MQYRYDKEKNPISMLAFGCMRFTKENGKINTTLLQTVIFANCSKVTLFIKIPPNFSSLNKKSSEIVIILNTFLKKQRKIQPLLNLWDKLLYHSQPSPFAITFQPSPFAIELDSRTFSSSLDIFGTPFEYDTVIIFLFNTYNKIFPYLHFLTTS